jgi:hypothetical protein
LIQKKQKIKTTSMLPRSLPVLHAFFAVRYFVPHITQKAKPAFPPALACTCCQGLRFFEASSQSVEQLRMKSGKTMMALCVMAEHSGFLLKRRVRASDSGVKRQQPRF